MSVRSISAGRGALPPATVGIAAAIFVIGGFGPNSLLAAFAIAVLLMGAFLLWRPGESPIFLFIFGFQWMQSSIEIFQANWQGVSMIDFSMEGGDLDLAIVLSLLGLLVLALGLRLGAGRWRQKDGALARSSASRFAPRYWFRLYAVAFVVATLAQSATLVIPGLSQPLLALAGLKWAFYWILAYATFSQPGTNRLYWLFAFALEVILGVGGYFADFRTPLVFTLLAVVAAGVHLSARKYLAVMSLAALALTSGIVWSAVKVDYRRFVSGGERAQIVTEGYSERIRKLNDLVSELDGSDLVDGWNALLSRVAYVEYFGVVLDRVPKLLPHEGGALWWDAISRPFMPRLLFPEKTIIDDTERTIRYVGLNRATMGFGTSMSIGYIAESYIDFGTFGMMVPIFGLGLLLGGFYRWIVGSDPSRLLGMALATATIVGASYMESSITKTFGGLIVAMLASWGMLRIAPRYLPWLQRRVVR